jgi:hypothetical protein
MFDLGYDAKHGVLLSRFFGKYSPADITIRDNAVRRFVTKNGSARGLMDFSAVDSIDVPLDLLIRRAHEPGILGHQRVIVAPSELTYSVQRVVAAHQLYARKAEPVLVRSLGEAYDILEIIHPAFSPIAFDRARFLDGVLHNVLDQLAEAVRRRSLDDATVGATAQRALGRRLMPPLPRHITLSDVFNAALRTKVLRDPLIRAQCRDCAAGLPLHSMSISPGRVTTYSCPVCNSWIVKFSQIDGTVPIETSGYVVGTFEVVPRVALDILGVHVPATET